MYMGMNRRETAALLTLVGIIVVGVASRNLLESRRGANLWIEQAPKENRRNPSRLPGASPLDSEISAFSPDRRLDLNRARAEDLETFSGIGPAKARSIIEYRDLNGPFQKASEIQNVSGIGETTWHALEPFVSVSASEQAQGNPALGAPSPTTTGTLAISAPGIITIPAPSPPPAPSAPSSTININAATAQQLQTLWNIGPAKSDAIIRYRQLIGPFRAPEDLTEVPGIGPETLTRNRTRIRVK